MTVWERIQIFCIVVIVLVIGFVAGLATGLTW